MSRQQRIHEILSAKLTPATLSVIDESNHHHVPKGAETHFKVLAVANAFENMPRIARHRFINACLTNEFNTGLHALTLHLYTPDEWSKQTTGAPASPACRGGKHRA